MSSRKAAQEPVEQLDDQITEMIYGTPETPNYLRIGFLRASLMASTGAIPASSATIPTWRSMRMPAR